MVAVLDTFFQAYWLLIVLEKTLGLPPNVTSSRKPLPLWVFVSRCIAYSSRIKKMITLTPKKSKKINSLNFNYFFAEIKKIVNLL
jgi:hypothetical protein